MPSTTPKRKPRTSASTTTPSKPTSGRSSSPTKKGSARRRLPAAEPRPVLQFPDGAEESVPAGAEDDGPKVAYEERYVAFIDILGFKELVARSARDEPDGADVAMLVAALDIDFQRVAGDFFADHGGDVEASDLRLHTFSDFVVVSCPRSQAGLALLVFVVWRICSDWLSKRYLSRGGITCGQLLHRVQSGRSSLVFGPAFVEAYLLESQVADYPRVMLSKAVRRAWRQAVEAGHADLDWVRPLVRPCPDGPHCIDLFAHLRSGGFRFLGNNHRVEAEQFRASLRHHLDDSADRPAWYRKTRWLVESFNTAIQGTRYADLGVALDGNG